MSKIEGISAETVEAVRIAIADVAPHYWEYPQAAITALLASGEVVLRKDVEALIEALELQTCECDGGQCNRCYALAKFTKGETK